MSHFLYDKSLDMTEKIIAFNRYVYNISKNDKPDIIIIDIPDAIMQYSQRILNGLGVVPFIAYNAVQSDIGILNIYQNNYPLEFYENMIAFCKYRFGICIENYNIANTKIMKSDDNTQLEYLFLKSSFVESHIDSSISDSLFVFNSFDESSLTRVYTRIETKLLSNVEQM